MLAPPRTEPIAHSSAADRRTLLSNLARFQSPSLVRSVGQLASTGVAYAAIVAGMYVSLHVSILLFLALAAVASGLLVRLFIIQHDCGHASYFRSRRANEVVGWLCSIVTFAPYANWRRQHAGHHAVWNNLDERHGGADIYSTCLTVQEYQALPTRKQLSYRALRHPVVAHLLLPPVIFLLFYRFPFDTPRAWRKERRSVHLTNFAIAAMLGGLAIAVGFGPVLAVHLAVMIPASIIGIWLFSVQHRFENSQWSHAPDWSAATAALHGSSYLKLPRVLQWFTGNIGFHHIHHLVPRVPNYRLQACHEALPAGAASVTTLTLRDAFRAPNYALWDEQNERMVRFPR